MFNPSSYSPQSLMAILAALACILSRTPARVLRHFTSWPVLACIFVVASISVPMLVIGYIAPCGAVQDTVASGELLAGRSAYPPDLRPVINRVLKDNPLPTTVSWLRGLQSSNTDCLFGLDLNAHPPLVSVALEPVVAIMGYFKPILLFQAISIASFVLMIWLWSKALGIVLQPRLWIFFLLVLLGSEPVFEVFRGAGLSGFLAMLVVAEWYLLRTERNEWAGGVLAIASGIKLFPIVACGALVFGRMRALFAAAVSSICIVLGIILLEGSQILNDYLATAHLDVSHYGWQSNNYSLFAKIQYFLNGNETLLLPLVILVYGSLCLIGGIIVFRLRNHRTICCDFGMALAAVLMCLLSPVVWTHYFIILFLPLCIVSYYSRWWESKVPSVAFFLIIASLDLSGPPLHKLTALFRTDLVWSLPMLGVLTLFAWLCLEGYRVPTTPGLRRESFWPGKLQVPKAQSLSA